MDFIRISIDPAAALHFLENDSLIGYIYITSWKWVYILNATIH